ncbi:Ger(x)C family spore germination protein [Cohnella panacarvi]|uniref:Ger(x)C family spore germination protein n=1 Tax=Cohnella panacarvi TaxID=400776 RepID=UPI00047DDA83|nr:Ger(x)C family spore germination protein [Cohnella panacarvi]
MDRRAIKLTGTMLVCTMLIGGCWDRVEIDQRGFVIGVAIDAPVQSEQARGGESSGKYRVTFQIVTTSAIKAGQGKSGGGDGEGKGKAYTNITVQEKTFSAVAAKLSNRTSRLPFMEHLKTIVVSSTMARSSEGLGNMFDFFLRDNDMRRSAHVLIAKEEARKALELEVPNEPLPSIYLNIFDRNRRSSSFIPPQVRIGDVQEKLLQYETFVIPEVSLKGKEEASLESLAIIDGRANRMVGSLRGRDTQSLNFMRGTVKGGVVNFKLEGRESALQLEKASSKIVLANRDPSSLAFTIRISVNGSLNETTALDNFSEQEALDKIEQAVSSTIASNCEDTLEKLQRKFKKDVVGIGSYLYRNHYRLWQKVEGNWERGDMMFSHVRIKVEVRTKVRRVGNIQQIRRG